MSRNFFVNLVAVLLTLVVAGAVARCHAEEPGTWVWPDDGKIEYLHADGKTSFDTFNGQYPFYIPGDTKAQIRRFGFTHIFLVGCDVAHLNASLWIGYSFFGVYDFGLDFGTTVFDDKADAATFGINFKKTLPLVNLPVWLCAHIEHPWDTILSDGTKGIYAGGSVAVQFR